MARDPKGNIRRKDRNVKTTGEKGRSPNFPLLFFSDMDVSLKHSISGKFGLRLGTYLRYLGTLVGRKV